MVILGISIGTRTSGIAILDNKRLITWNTLSFKNSWSEKKNDHIISKYEAFLKDYKVNIIVLKIPRISHHTEAILNLITRIQALIAYHGCMVEYTSNADIKTALPHIRNSNDVITHAATLYPVLMTEQQKELANKNKYHDKMFEAVIVAHLAQVQHGEQYLPHR